MTTTTHDRTTGLGASEMAAKLLDMPAEDYHALEHVWGHTQMEDLRRSPPLFHGKYIAHTIPPEQKDSFDFGTAVHIALLEPERWDDAIVSIPIDVLTSNGARRGKKWEAWRDAHEDKIQLLPRDVAHIRYLRAVLRQNEALKVFLDAKGPVESSIIWQDEPTGLRRKTRPDKLAMFGKHRRNECVIVDLKTSYDPYPATFRKQMADLGYHRKAACCVDGAIALDLDVIAFVLIAIPKKIGYDPIVYEVARSAISLGREENREGLNDLARRLRTGDWHHPNFDTIHELDLPEWAYPAIELTFPE